jgi:hypothetical protein
MRDFEKQPYTADEERVAKWLVEHTPLGGGDDPIGFVLASSAFTRRFRDEAVAAVEGLMAGSVHGKLDSFPDIPADWHTIRMPDKAALERARAFLLVWGK